MIKNTAAENTREKLISTLEQDSQAVIDWFKINEMIVNPDKFQAIFVQKNCRMKDSYVLNINNQTINSENCIKLLGVEIDNTLSFEQRNSILYKKASNQMLQEECRSTWALWKKKCFQTVSAYLILIPVLLYGITVFQDH